MCNTQSVDLSPYALDTRRFYRTRCLCDVYDNDDEEEVQ